MTVTVVIPVLDGTATLGAQLAALDLQHGAPPFTVVVVDNGSSDDTAELARAYPACTYAITVVNEPVRGINSARNAGIAFAPEGAVLLCDADDEVHADWLRAMIDALSDGTWVGGRLDYTRLNSVKTRLVWGAPECSKYVESEPFADSTYGCNCGFWRSMWSELGGFETLISGIGGDETEFFQRAYAAGFRRLDVPAALVSYRLREGLRCMLRQRYRQGRNLVLLRSLPGGRLLPTTVTWAAAWREMAKCLLAAPLYLRPAARRYQWAASVSSHFGQLRGLYDGGRSRNR